VEDAVAAHAENAIGYNRAVPNLILGPILRYVGPTEATVWVETDGPCEVGALGATARTFEVAGHHYAIVIADGLRESAEHDYELTLDGDVAWPQAGEPKGSVRTPRREDELRLAFASCRVAAPHEPPYTLSKTDDDHGRGVDALAALARRMRGSAPRTWPDALLLVGDQVYADEVTPAIRERMRARHGQRDAPLEVADFEEYTWLYHEAWGDEQIRWLLASIPSAMIFDDHDVRDDWNTSGAWVRYVRSLPWWRERLIGAYMSYWLYQHLGNMTPAELRESELLAALQADDGDGEPLLRAYAERSADEVAGTRWSFRRDFGRTRLIVLDSRAGRIVEDDRRRRMLSEEQWEWVRAQMTGDVDHLLIATSLPFLLSPALHDVEAWNEAVCAGAWGGLAARAGEKLRQELDLEHWAAFGDSFHALVEELRAVGAGERGEAPGSIIVLSGDVHHAYVAETAFPAGSGVRSAIVQAVCSPMRNPLDARERRFMRAMHRGPAAAVARWLARSAGVRAPRMRWRLMAPATFDNHVGTLELDGRGALMRIECTRPEEWREPLLHESFARTIAEI
jgi:phosphodiesterase/alkaline phosphatase D-like protein